MKKTIRLTLVAAAAVAALSLAVEPASASLPAKAFHVASAPANAHHPYCVCPHED